ncbi:hypothetical protein HanIR_Chr17g0887761 [Helianthus annuus]|nr:hypothetical protein HanIR_Chr17g0887761 [Helianthus annuus]
MIMEVSCSSSHFAARTVFTHGHVPPCDIILCRAGEERVNSAAQVHRLLDTICARVSSAARGRYMLDTLLPRKCTACQTHYARG